MYKMSIKYIFPISMFDFTMGFHIVATSKDLMANRTFMFLRTMNVRMVPTIRNCFVARHAAIQSWKCAGELDEKCWVVNIVISTWWCSWISRIVWGLSVREEIVYESAVSAAVSTAYHSSARIKVVTTWRHQRMQNHSITCNNTGIMASQAVGRLTTHNFFLFLDSIFMLFSFSSFQI